MDNSYINDGRTVLDYPAADRDEAIRAAGGLLLQDGIIEERFIEAMIKTCDTFGAYIVLTPGVAVPHAAPGDGARENGFSILQLKTPVKFGNQENDPVKLVVAVSARDADSHLEMLGWISRFILNRSAAKQLMEATEKKTVLDILEKARREKR